MKIGAGILYVGGRRAGTITDLRVRPVRAAAPISKDKCTRCGGDHHLSRCTWPTPKD